MSSQEPTKVTDVIQHDFFRKVCPKGIVVWTASAQNEVIHINNQCQMTIGWKHICAGEFWNLRGAHVYQLLLQLPFPMCSGLWMAIQAAKQPDDRPPVQGFSFHLSQTKFPAKPPWATWPMFRPMSSKHSVGTPWWRLLTKSCGPSAARMLWWRWQQWSKLGTRSWFDIARHFPSQFSLRHSCSILYLWGFWTLVLAQRSSHYIWLVGLLGGWSGHFLWLVFSPPLPPQPIPNPMCPCPQSRRTPSWSQLSRQRARELLTSGAVWWLLLAATLRRHQASVGIWVLHLQGTDLELWMVRIQFLHHPVSVSELVPLIRHVWRRWRHTLSCILVSVGCVPWSILHIPWWSHVSSTLTMLCRRVLEEEEVRQQVKNQCTHHMAKPLPRKTYHRWFSWLLSPHLTFATWHYAQLVQEEIQCIPSEGSKPPSHATHVAASAKMSSLPDGLVVQDFHIATIPKPRG